MNMAMGKFPLTLVMLSNGEITEYGKQYIKRSVSSISSVLRAVCQVFCEQYVKRSASSMSSVLYSHHDCASHQHGTKVRLYGFRLTRSARLMRHAPLWI